LQSNAERKHGNQRGHAHRDADRGQRIPQQGFAQLRSASSARSGIFIAAPPFRRDESRKLASSSNQFAIRQKNQALGIAFRSARSWVTITTVMPKAG
jgi:hypothetical protein